MNQPVLEVRDLSISFRQQTQWYCAIRNITFFLQKNETLCLVGESGCGKSVTALSILGLLPQPPARIDSGKIFFKDQDLRGFCAKEMRRIRGNEIGMIFQEPMTSLNPVFPVGEQIVEAIRLHQCLSKKQARKQAIEAMSRVGIAAPTDRYYDYPHQLSGGMRQRIMIAMVLTCAPKVLLADEPTTALDVTIQAQILELVAKLQQETRMSVLWITHDLGVVAQIAHRVAVMYAGVIMELAQVDNLFSQPAHPYTIALYESVPKIRQEQNLSRLPMIPGRVPSLDAVPKYCRFFDRCIKASAACKEREPTLKEIRPQHFVRCIKA